MRFQIGSVLAVLAYSHSVLAAWPQHYRRQDYESENNGTYLPQQLPSASSTNYNTTSVTVTYTFIPESQISTSTPVPTVSVISSLVVISTYTKTTSIEVLPTEDAVPSTEPEVASSTATRLPYPVAASGSPYQSFAVPGNGTVPGLSASQTSQSSRVAPSPKVWRPKPENDTCAGATLNVVNAHLDYWYTETYTHTISTVSIQFNTNDSQTGWTILPATTTFDISTAITQATCGASSGLNTQYNFTTVDYDCYTTPTPIASSTTLLSVDAFKPTNQTTGNGTQIPNIATQPPKAVATLPSAAGTYTEGTPFVYFSEYEIESSQPTTLPNGSAACAIDTKMFMLNRLFSFPLHADEEEEVSQENLATDNTTGVVHPNFMRAIRLANTVTPGTWTAEPTVIVVVERGVVAQAVLAVAATAAGGPLITPTPTLPSFLSSIEKTTPDAPTTNYSPRVEQTADSLDVPTTVKPFNVGRLRTFVAHVEHTDTTLVLPAPTDTDVITTKINGQTVTATALNNVMNDASGNNNGNSNGGSTNGQGGSNQGGDSNAQNNGNDEGSWVVRPFVAHVENSDITIDIPAPATLKVATAAFQGKTITATALNAAETGSGGSGNGEKGNAGSNTGGSSNGGSGSGSNGGQNGGSNGNGASNNNGQNGGGGVFGNLISAIGNVAKPTNAAQVLSQALAQGHNDATAAAIAAGIGGLAAADAAADNSNGGGYGGSGNGQGSSGSGSGLNNGGSNGASGFHSSNGGSNSGSGSGNAIGDGLSQPGRLGASPGQVITLGGATVTASPAQAFVVGGQTVVPGGAPITVDGTVVSIPASTNAVVIDGTTKALTGDSASATAFNINGMQITAQSGVGFPIDGQTLQAGGAAITVDGTRLSLAPGGTALVIGSSTSAIGALEGAASQIPELVVGSQTFTANAATQFFLARGETLTPGGTAVVSGTTVSLASDASAVVINGQTHSVGSPSAAMITTGPEIIRANGQAYAPNAGGTYLISGQTLTPGGKITITGSNGAETISLASSGTELVAIISGHTITSKLDAAAAAEATAAPILTIGGQTFTALPGTDGFNPTYLINGKVLSTDDEETVTVAGRTYVVSLSPEATLLEVEELGSNGKGTTTRIQTLFPATATGRTSTMTASAGLGTGTSGGGSGSGNDDSEAATGVSAAPTASQTGAASSSTGAIQLAGLCIAAGTIVLAIML